MPTDPVLFNALPADTKIPDPVHEEKNVLIILGTIIIATTINVFHYTRRIVEATKSGGTIDYRRLYFIRDY